MGIESVAIFADGDADAPFVSEAHQAVALNGRTPAESYLDVAKVLDAAQRAGADAIHPGYGFLAGVPTLSSVEVTEDLDVLEAADGIGYPVLVKATAGGGGKGMRVVESADELVDAIAGAQREAQSSFGNGVVFLEKYLPAPRHIEIQVMGDQHGSLVHLFERECSIQRRHQKIIEEAPSPVLSDALRSAMGDAAVAAARAIDYSSAGTVEFLLDGHGEDAEFWFLEVNTRIQVEHPVTEEVTGIDLVREQLRVAAGAPLGFAQDDLQITGHAIEARLYAEDPANDFLPAIGTLPAFAVPASPSARVDTGVETGSIIGVDFDPMLAKVIVHASTRDEAARRLALVLETMTIAGVTTNRDFLVATLRHDAFLAGDTTTDFIDRVQPARVFEPNDQAVAAAAIAAAMLDQCRNRAGATTLGFMSSGYRNSAMPAERAAYLIGERTVMVSYRPSRSGGFHLTTQIDDHPETATMQAMVIDCELDQGLITVQVDGVRSRHHVVAVDDRVVVQSPQGAVTLQTVPLFPDYASVDVAGGQTAPMPGKVLSVHVAVGDAVQAGQVLVIMEAMKMEHTIAAPADGVVAELRCSPGDQVDNGFVLVVLEEPE